VTAKERMRILVVTPFPPRRDGIAAYAHHQVERLRAEGHDVKVLSPPDGDGDLRERFEGGKALFRAARLGRAYDRIVVHFQPTLFHPRRRPAGKVMASFALLWLAVRRPQLEIVVHEADPPIRWRPDYALLRRAFRRGGRLWFHTDEERTRLERDYGIPARGELVPHLVSARPSSKDEARRQLGIDHSGTVLVCAGFLHPSKGFDRALDAFPAENGARLFIVGSVRQPTDENREYARTLAERCASVPGATLIDQFVSDEEFDLWLSAADWVVLPYRRSWSSGVLAKAQAIGAPAIVTAVGGLAEQAGSRDVVVHTEEELAAALRRAVATPRSDGGAPRPQSQKGAGADGPKKPSEHRHESEWDPESHAAVTRRGKKVLIGLILISVALAALAQLTLKHGMNQVTHQGDIPLSLRDPMGLAKRVVLNASVWAGLLTFVLSASVWLIVLSRTSLSFAYPFASLTYVLILLFDRLVLNEPISALRYGGVALIIAGLLLISRTHHAT
jgi:glycosyltransferase involved in cell wall biosynthesis/multidrug transporter EmrE-like cation transporter